MKAYSMDLREPVFADCDAGMEDRERGTGCALPRFGQAGQRQSPDFSSQFIRERTLTDSPEYSHATVTACW